MSNQETCTSPQSDLHKPRGEEEEQKREVGPKEIPKEASFPQLQGSVYHLRKEESNYTPGLSGTQVHSVEPLERRRRDDYCTRRTRPSHNSVDIGPERVESRPDYKDKYPMKTGWTVMNFRVETKEESDRGKRSMR